MYKIIISSLCVLLGFAACRSGKGVTQTQKGGKDSIKVVENKVPDSVIYQEIIRKKMEAILADTAAYSKKFRETQEQFRQESKELIDDLKANGFAYSKDISSGGTKYVIFNAFIPQIVKQNFPDIFFFTGEGILGQGNRKQYYAGNNDDYGVFPNCFNTVFMNDSLKKTMPLKLQLEIVLTLSKYPFPQCSIIDVTEEKYPSTYQFVPYTHKAHAKIDNQDVFIRITYRYNEIYRFTIYYENDRSLTLQLDSEQ